MTLKFRVILIQEKLEEAFSRLANDKSFDKSFFKSFDSLKHRKKDLQR